MEKRSLNRPLANPDYKSAKHIKFGTVGDSPYTQKVKYNNEQIIDRMRMAKKWRLFR